MIHYSLVDLSTLLLTNLKPMLVWRYELATKEEKAMSVLAIGDIHGCYTAFDTLLEKINIQKDDIIVTLGDYVDRGPDSKKVIERLIEIQKTGQLVALRGNHELMMLDAALSQFDLEYWLVVGGKETLASYSEKLDLAAIPDAHWNFIKNVCVDWWETEKNFFVHANANPNLPLNKQSPQDLFWKKFSNSKPHYSGKIMICGHTSQKNGFPLNIGHSICLDTWVYGDGWLTCLDITTGKVWQTNQKGNLRTALIDEFKTLPKTTSLKPKQYSRF